MVCLGVLAHVDAGKTTLSERILYLCGQKRAPGSVDAGTSSLDAHQVERRRGITVFSGQAQGTWKGRDVALVDTPGHWEFAPEMERCLGILDCAVLVVSAVDGIQSGTQAIWKLLEQEKIPVLIFLNKTDQPGARPQGVLEQLKERFSPDILPMDQEPEALEEQLAMVEEQTLEAYVEGRLDRKTLTQAAARAVAERRLFPLFQGSALSGQGVEALLDGATELVRPVFCPEGAPEVRIYQVRRDGQSRVCLGRVMKGTLRPKQELAGEKIHELRQYQADRYRPIPEAAAGALCAMTGPVGLAPGDTAGPEGVRHQGQKIVPVVGTRVVPPETVPAAVALEQLRQLEQEEPTMRLRWDAALEQIQMATMGQMGLEVLQELVQERFGWRPAFSKPEVLYRETLEGPVRGIGHFEPLRHYAEVHLLLEPGPRGSGIRFFSRCSTDALGKNWQRLIETHVLEKEHVGPLTGSPVTDMQVTLLAGRSHEKHTEGGDFRQAVYRAIRQGLFQAKMVLLEPVYDVSAQVPARLAGRVLTDLARMGGQGQPPRIQGEWAWIQGSCPVSEMMDYPEEFRILTRGEGTLSLLVSGYAPCHDTQQVVQRRQYDRERDTENPADSVFCSHGAGFSVKWSQVAQYAHISLS